MLDSSTSPAELLDHGRHARHRGDPEIADPYPAGSEQHAKWLEGYRYPDGHEAERDSETFGIKC